MIDEQVEKYQKRRLTMSIDEVVDRYLNEGANVTKKYGKWRNKMLDHIDKIGGKQGSFNDIKLPKMGNSGTAINIVHDMMDISKPKDYEKMYTELSTAKTSDELIKVLKNWVKYIKAR